MAKYIASVKWEGKIEIIERDYPTANEFKKDLRANGYQVRFITTEENFDRDCEEYYWKLTKKRNIARAIRESRKRAV